MRQVLRFLGTRYGVALVLGLLVLGTVGLVRAAGGGSSSPPPTDPVVAPPPGSVAATAGDDSVATSEAPATPSDAIIILMDSRCGWRVRGSSPA